MLRKKKVISITTCDLCMRESEDYMHAICLCNDVLRLWRACFSRIDFSYCHNFGLFVWDLLEREQKIDLELFFSMVWGIWHRRNLFIHETELLDPWSVIDEVVSFIQEFKCSQLLCKTSVKEKS